MLVRDRVYRWLWMTSCWIAMKLPWKWRYALRKWLPPECIWGTSAYQFWAMAEARAVAKRGGIDNRPSLPLDMERFMGTSLVASVYRSAAKKPSARERVRQYEYERLLMGVCLVEVLINGRTMIQVPLGAIGWHFPAAIPFERGSVMTIRLWVPNAKARKRLKVAPRSTVVQVLLSGVAMRRVP